MLEKKCIGPSNRKFYERVKKKMKTCTFNSTAKDALRIFLLCMAWYTLSTSGNIIVKTLLMDFPYPMTVTMVQLLSIWVYLQPVLKLWGVPPVDTSRTPWRYYFTMIFPLAFGKFITSVSAHVSLWKVTVSYAHTGKLILKSN